jgi:hypothetical protein
MDDKISWLQYLTTKNFKLGNISGHELKTLGLDCVDNNIE